MFGCPLYVWMPPCMFRCHHCLDNPLYVWMPPVCLCAPICLDIPCMFGHSHMFGCPHVNIWKILGCLLYIYNTKKACFVRLRGCPYAPYTFECPHMFGCLLLYFDLPICLDTTHMVGCSSHLWMPHTFGGIQTYRGQPNIWRASKHMRMSKHMGHPTIQRGNQNP